MEVQPHKMQSGRIFVAATLLAAIIAIAFAVDWCNPRAIWAQSEEQPGLSPYWDPDVSRWEPFILPPAQQRNIDPDLVAAVIWKESLGRAWERSSVGAVGLMGLMPFEWRPSAEELANPWTNLAWGVRALAHTIRDGNGDLYYALAAYNGGWGKIHLRVTRNYAADVLNHYARAVAMRHGLPEDGNWIAIFSVENGPDPNTITVVGPQRPLTRYTERPWIQADIPSVPVGVSPHSTVIQFVDEYNVEHRVNMWLVAADNSPLPTAATYTALPSPPDPTTLPSSTTVPAQTPVPTNTPAPIRPGAAIVRDSGADLRPGATTWWHPIETLPAGTELTLSGYDPFFPDWVYVRTIDGASIGWVQTDNLNINGDLFSLPQVTPLPTLAPTPLIAATPTLTPTAPVECQGGPLQIEAWDLKKVLNLGGSWTATIYARGFGGDCLYTYYWNEELKGGPMSGPITFEVTTPDRFGTIMGTAWVTSTGETAQVRLFFEAP
jgi:hypothetical protein